MKICDNLFQNTLNDIPDYKWINLYERKSENKKYKEEIKITNETANQRSPLLVF